MLHAVSTPESLEIENAGIGGLDEFCLNLTNNSVAKCEDWQWLPPLPNIIILPLFFAVFFIASPIIME